MITPEMAAHYENRTSRHIELVNKAITSLANQLPELYIPLMLRGPIHDLSKWKEPERTPYTHLTWRYRLKDEGKEYKVSPEMEEAIKQATFHHITTNPHHPEYWDRDFIANADKRMNQKDRDAIPDEMVDATSMDPVSIAEMVCDWHAMGIERGNTAKSWADKVVNKRWKFTDEQVSDIYRYIGLLDK